MHKILFYKDKKGKRPVADYLTKLSTKTDKDSRIKFNKYNDYIQSLSEYGTLIGEPYIKHVEGELWELRPINERAFFVAWTGGSFVFLHHFVKKTQKTPVREIEKARRELADLKERGLDDG